MKDLYTNGYIVQYQDELSLERDPVYVKADVEDSIHTVKDGDTLQSISFRYYRNEFYWYIIADVNEVDNPFFLETGTQLIIPNKVNV